MIEKWVSALLRQVEKLYDGVFFMLEHNTLGFLLNNWIVIVIVACVICFAVDQTLWVFRYKPYREWMRNMRVVNAALDRILDWILKLFGRGGAHAQYINEDEAYEDQAYDEDARDDAYINARESAAMEVADDSGTRRIPKMTAQKTDAVYGDWTERPTTYEGVRWWEPKTRS